MEQDVQNQQFDLKGVNTMSKKNWLTKIFLPIVCLMLTFSFMGASVFAADTTNKAPSVKMTAENEVSFSNLENLKPGEHVEFIITDQNGEPATIGIERIRTHNDDALTRASGDSWKVYYTGGIVNCHFYMTVTNNRVTSVYDDWILIVGGTYSDKSLTKTSTYGKLSFKAEAYSGIMAGSCWLKGTVTGSGNTVNVTWQM